MFYNQNQQIHNGSEESEDDLHFLYTLHYNIQNYLQV
jgi:hypothetical protein